MLTIRIDKSLNYQLRNVRFSNLALSAQNKSLYVITELQGRRDLVREHQSIIRSPSLYGEQVSITCKVHNIKRLS